MLVLAHLTTLDEDRPAWLGSEPPAAPFTDYLWWDLARLGMAALSLWLTALMLRLLLQRLRNRRRPDDNGRTEVWLYVCLIVTLLSVGGLRIVGMGMPPDVRFWLSLAIVSTCLAGVFERTRFPVRAPHRR